MKLKEKERFVYKTLKELATSRIFFFVIVCEMISAIANFSKLFVKEIHPAYTNNQIINTLIVLITVLCVSAYSVAVIICYINIRRYFMGETQTQFGLRYIYKVHLIGNIVVIGCAFISYLPQIEFKLLYVAAMFLSLMVYFTIIYLIYSSVIRNAIECAEFAANGFIRGKIGNGIVVYMAFLLISQVFALFSSPLFKFLQYDSYFTWLKLTLTTFATVSGFVSIILSFILLLKFKKAFNTK